MSYRLETERLVLRPFTETDAPFVLTLMNSPGWLAFIGDRNIRTPEDAVSYLQNGPMKSYGINGFGLSLVGLKTTGTPVGTCGLLQRDYLAHPDIGFAFLPDYMGQGYAVEIASATLTYASETLHIPVVLATVLPANTRSIRLLEKIGLTFSQVIPSPAQGVDVLLYSTEQTDPKTGN